MVQEALHTWKLKTTVSLPAYSTGIMSTIGGKQAFIYYRKLQIAAVLACVQPKGEGTFAASFHSTSIRSICRQEDLKA